MALFDCRLSKSLICWKHVNSELDNAQWLWPFSYEFGCNCNCTHQLHIKHNSSASTVNLNQSTHYNNPFWINSLTCMRAQWRGNMHDFTGTFRIKIFEECQGVFRANAHFQWTEVEWIASNWMSFDFFANPWLKLNELAGLLWPRNWWTPDLMNTGNWTGNW